MGRKDLKVGNRLQRRSLEFRKYTFTKKTSIECCVESKQWFIGKMNQTQQDRSPFQAVC